LVLVWLIRLLSLHPCSGWMFRLRSLDVSCLGDTMKDCTTKLLLWFQNAAKINWKRSIKQFPIAPPINPFGNVYIPA
jgi:hypothetical protein